MMWLYILLFVLFGWFLSWAYARWARRYGMTPLNPIEAEADWMRKWGERYHESLYERRAGEAEKKKPDYSVYDAADTAPDSNRLRDDIAYYDEVSAGDEAKTADDAPRPLHTLINKRD